MEFYVVSIEQIMERWNLIYFTHKLIDFFQHVFFDILICMMTYLISQI